MIPTNAGAEYVLGELARQESQWPDAIAHFTRASKLDAGFGDAYLGLGVCLLSAKQFSEAIAPLETAVKLEPRNPPHTTIWRWRTTAPVASRKRIRSLLSIGR